MRVLSRQRLSEQLDDAFYFPSYEVITGNFNRGRYFEEDLRGVRKEGVEHVMRLFMEYYTDINKVKKRRLTGKSVKDNFVAEMEKELDVICDEELIEKGLN